MYNFYGTQLLPCSVSEHHPKSRQATGKLVTHSCMLLELLKVCRAESSTAFRFSVDRALYQRRASYSTVYLFDFIPRQSANCLRSSPHSSGDGRIFVMHSLGYGHCYSSQHKSIYTHGNVVDAQISYSKRARCCCSHAAGVRLTPLFARRAKPPMTKTYTKQRGWWRNMRGQQLIIILLLRSM